MRTGFLIFLLIVSTAGQHGSGVDALLPQAMAAERVEDSYAIYAELLPNKLGQSKFLSIRDATITAVQPNEPCFVPPAITPIERAKTAMMNPHVAVTPPKEEHRDYEAMLSDFDAHCHERAYLSEGLLTSPLPIRLLNETQQVLFEESRNKNPPSDAAAYRTSSSLYAFSQVYFNSDHTKGMVYFTFWCGGLCGKGFWEVFGKQSGQWKRLMWKSGLWIS